MEMEGVHRFVSVTHHTLTCSPAAQKTSLRACHAEEVDSDSFLGAAEESSSGVLESLPNTQAFITG